VASGTRVFDWEAPPEWRIRAARLTGPDGETVVDFADSTLHVVSYSEPIRATLPLEELQPHLHSLPQQPELVPYVTSYYRRDWGFCLPHRRRAALAPGDYTVEIDGEFVDGGVPFAWCDLPGDSDVFIVDSQGRLVAHRNPTPVLRGTTLGGGEYRGIRSGLNGKRVVMASETVRIGRQNLIVIAEQPLLEAMSPAIRLVAVILLMLIAGIVAATVLSNRMASAIAWRASLRRPPRWRDTSGSASSTSFTTTTGSR